MELYKYLLYKYLVLGAILLMCATLLDALLKYFYIVYIDNYLKLIGKIIWTWISRNF